MKDTLSDIAFRITAYRHGDMDDKEYQASVLSILEAYMRQLGITHNKEYKFDV